MELVFSYGTLQQGTVQVATFGRRLEGRADALQQAELAQIKIEDPDLAAEAGDTHYQNVRFNGRPESCVHGTVFEVTDDELAVADRYESRAGYRRIAVKLASGAQAWIYVDARTAPAYL